MDVREVHTSLDTAERDRLLGGGEMPGVAQAIVTYEAVEKAYFAAVAATPPAVIATTYAVSTSPR